MGVHAKVNAVFLDRDGVINKAIIHCGKPYPPKSLFELEILEGVQEGLRQLKKLNFLLIVITNQPDVARGIMAVKIVDDIHNHLRTLLTIDDIFSCYHDNVDNCNCRKPKAGMIFAAAKKWNINLNQSFIVGDRWRDIEAGKNAGIKTILLDYGYNEKYIKPDYTCFNFQEVVQTITSHYQ